MTTRGLLAFFLLALFLCAGATAQTTAFTQQGQLNVSGNPASGNFDFEFRLFDALSGGSQVGSTLQRLNVAVTNGIYAVSLDFGAAALPGANRFLDITVRPAGGGAFTQLSPRQAVTSSPYAVRSLNAGTAATSTNFTGALAGEVTGTQAATTIVNNAVTNAKLAAGSVTAAKIATGEVVKSLNGLEDSVTLAAGANITITPAGNTLTIASTGGGGSAILNQTTQQSAANFNIDGTGTANTFSAATQYNIGTNRVLSVPGSDNIFAGVGAGSANTTGSENAFFGKNTGISNTTGSGNAFFGSSVGFLNTTGGSNAFFGTGAGFSNTTGFSNAFFGRNAGQANTTSNSNSFFGAFTGDSNTTGSTNAFFGTHAGSANTTGNSNAFFGMNAGLSNTTASNNAFFGTTAGAANTTGTSNSFFGTFAGNSNTTGTSNAFFGTNAGDSNTTGNSNAFFGTTAGLVNTTGGSNAFYGTGTGNSNTTGNANSFFGDSAGSANTTGGDNAFFGAAAGFLSTTGIDNAFFGRSAGNTNVGGSNNTIIGSDADVNGPSLSFATAIGSGAIVGASNRVQVGRDTLDTVRIGDLGAAVATNLCISANNVLSACTSSGRYKENVQPLRSSLNLVQKLRPVTFDWKDRKENDLGLIAEEVAAVDPLLVTRDRKGEIQGVKYDQLNVVLINAVKEQQAMIERQQRQIETLVKANQDAARQTKELRSRFARIERKVSKRPKGLQR